MSRRKRRADKRIHSERLFEVFAGIVDDPKWRDELLKLEPTEKLAIDTQAFSGQGSDAARLVRRFHLSYVLSLDVNNEIEDPEPAEGAKVFKLRSSRHPIVYGYLEEMPEDIGLGEDAV